MMCKGKKPIPPEASASEAEPSREKSPKEENRFPDGQDERAHDPRVEPIERR